MRKRTRRRVTIGILLTVLWFLLVEARARGRREDILRDTVDELRSECGQSSALIADYHQLTIDIRPAGYVVEDDHAGPFYNFSDGERRVVNAPAGAPYSLWIFGNSGTMDLYLADIDTFAAHLQTYFPLYRVHNRSAGGQVIAGQLAWLKETPVKAGDLVLFIDGYMDKDRDTRALIDQAALFTLRRGGAFVHFRQPFAFPLDTPGIPLNLAPPLFIEYAHLTEIGAMVEARKVYDQLSIY